MTDNFRPVDAPYDFGVLDDLVDRARQQDPVQHAKDNTTQVDQSRAKNPGIQPPEER